MECSVCGVTDADLDYRLCAVCGHAAHTDDVPLEKLIGEIGFLEVREMESGWFLSGPVLHGTYPTLRDAVNALHERTVGAT